MDERFFKRDVVAVAVDLLGTCLLIDGVGWADRVGHTFIDPTVCADASMPCANRGARCSYIHEIKLRHKRRSAASVEGVRTV